MLKIILVALFPFLLLSNESSDSLISGPAQNGRRADTGTLEKMIVGSGSVSMDVNLSLLDVARRGAKQAKASVLRFEVEPDSFFTVLVFNDELRGPLPSSMKLIPQTTAALPAKLRVSSGQLVVESMEWGGPYDLVVRDAKTGFVFFNIEGHTYDYDASQHLL